MADQVFPTKGNLLNVKKSLSLAKVGYELLDRKRNVLIRELMMMVDAAKALRSSISETYKDAYNALQKANITMGLISRGLISGDNDVFQGVCSGLGLFYGICKAEHAVIHLCKHGGHLLYTSE